MLCILAERRRLSRRAKSKALANRAGFWYAVIMRKAPKKARERAKQTHRRAAGQAPEQPVEEDKMASFRDEIFVYAKKKYRTLPEYLWRRYPGYAVLRHGDNKKWFALFMDVPAGKLGLGGSGRTDILNVKLRDPLLADLLVQQKGFLRGYHISRGNWVSILLDGTVPLAEICHWLDESYAVTASKSTQNELRPPKEWIVPANPKYYDVQSAFEAADEINWKQGKAIKTGDTVFLYVAAPVSAILYKCRVTKTDIPCHFDDGNVHMSGIMKIKLLKRYPPDRFTFDVLGKDYGIHAVRGPRGIPASLREALK